MLHQGLNQGPSGYKNEALDHWAMRDDAGGSIESCGFNKKVTCDILFCEYLTYIPGPLC